MKEIRGHRMSGAGRVSDGVVRYSPFKAGWFLTMAVAALLVDRSPRRPQPSSFRRDDSRRPAPRTLARQSSPPHPPQELHMPAMAGIGLRLVRSAGGARRSARGPLPARNCATSRTPSGLPSVLAPRPPPRRRCLVATLLRPRTHASTRDHARSGHCRGTGPAFPGAHLRLHHVAVAALFYWWGGWAFAFWGVCARVLTGVFGHWLI